MCSIEVQNSRMPRWNEKEQQYVCEIVGAKQ